VSLLLNLLFVHQLDAAQFGAYSVSHSLSLTALGIVNALVLEPVSVFGLSWKSRARLYAVIQIAILVCISGLFAGIILGIGLVRPNWLPLELQSVLRTLALGLPALQLPWLVRRLSYLYEMHWLALAGSLASLVAAVSLSLAVQVETAEAALRSHIGVVALPALLATIALIITGGAARSVGGHKSTSETGQLLAESTEYGGSIGLIVLKQQWSFAAPLLASNLLSAIATQLHNYYFAAAYRLEAAAELRALQLFFAPLQTVLTASGIYILPRLVRAAHAEAGRGLGEFARHANIILLAGSILYVGIAALLLPVASAWLNRPGYAVSALEFGVMSVSFLLAAATLVPQATLKALKRTAPVALASTIGALTSLFCSVPLAASLGVIGAALTLIVRNVTTFGIIAHALRRVQRREVDGG